MAWPDPTVTAQKYDAFATAIVQGIDPTRAAIDAGYGLATAAATGRRLVASAEIQALVNLKRAQSAALVADTWDPRRIVNELASLAQQARNEGQLATARQCYRDIGEHIGMWPKVAPNVDARSLNIDMSGLTTDELRAMLQGAIGSSLYIEQDASSSTDAS